MPFQAQLNPASHIGNDMGLRGVKEGKLWKRKRHLLYFLAQAQLPCKAFCTMPATARSRPACVAKAAMGFNLLRTEARIA